jgi:hypothetical protein
MAHHHSDRAAVAAAELASAVPMVELQQVGSLAVAASAEAGTAERVAAFGTVFVGPCAAAVVPVGQVARTEAAAVVAVAMPGQVPERTAGQLASVAAPWASRAVELPKRCSSMFGRC